MRLLGIALLSLLLSTHALAEPSESRFRRFLHSLPHDIDQAKRATRALTAKLAPESTADQQRLLGLHLPPRVDPARPLCILIHGLDDDGSAFCDFASLLHDQTNQQVATFAYPSDQGLLDSASLFHDHLAALHETFPTLQINIIAYSMGSLVARQVIESDTYPGGVSRLIMIAPPNHGSSWAPLRLVLEVQEHYRLAHTADKWRPTWMITDGLGEASRDLSPNSPFLTQLNSRPRREGVRYTIIAGKRSLTSTIVASTLDASSNLIPKSWDRWSFRDSLARCATKLRNRSSKSDGPVSLSSAALDGVDDFVILPADHSSLCCSISSAPPLAWPIIADRLQN